MEEPLDRQPGPHGLGRLFFRSPVADFHCGLRGFRRDAILALDLQTTGMEFASEMVVKATLNELASPRSRPRSREATSDAPEPPPLARRLAAPPVPARSTARAGSSCIPGLFLMALGAAATVWLLPGPRVVGGITFDVQTLLLAGRAFVGVPGRRVRRFQQGLRDQRGTPSEDPRLTRLFQYVTLETGLIVGVALIIVGAAGAIYAFANLASLIFGELDPSEKLTKSRSPR